MVQLRYFEPLDISSKKRLPYPSSVRSIPCYEKCRNKRDEKEESISETFFPLCQIHLQKEAFGNLDDQLIDFIGRDRRQVSHIMYLQDLGYKKANSSLAI